MASEVANCVNAKCLILNHFSQRYKPLNYVKEKTDKDCDEDEDLDFVQKLVDEAKLTFKGNSVQAAYDLFSYKV